MMISFPFLKEPILFTPERIPVLCLEQPRLFRETVTAFLQENPAEQQIIFSENYTPFPYKNYVHFITQYCDFQTPSACIKKIYSDIAFFCATEFMEETARLEREILLFLDKINTNYDFDFSYAKDFSLPDFLKSQNFKPAFNTDNALDNLLRYILFMQKYSLIRCFIFLNLHAYFTESELVPFFADLRYRKIQIFLLESCLCFEKSKQEALYIVDKDFCEILDNLE